ncbi:hypothetical protein FRB90_009119 [Tulasnella sp. 427]|nr:hypothetical protein FRB90_009119 [Tulasnella sp. 427]
MSFQRLALFSSITVGVVIMPLIISYGIHQVMLLAAALEDSEERNKLLQETVERANQELANRESDHVPATAELEEKLRCKEREIEELKQDKARLNKRVQEQDHLLKNEQKLSVYRKEVGINLVFSARLLGESLSERNANAERADRKTLAAARRVQEDARRHAKERIQQVTAEAEKEIAAIRKTADEALAELNKEKSKTRKLACRLAAAEQTLNTLQPSTPPRSATPPDDVPLALRLKAPLAPPALAAFDVSTSDKSSLF